MAISIYTNRGITIAAAEFIENNRVSAYVGMKGGFTFYNVNGVIWQVWQDGCGNYPISNGIKVENFTF